MIQLKCHFLYEFNMHIKKRLLFVDQDEVLARTISYALKINRPQIAGNIRTPCVKRGTAISMLKPQLT